MTELQRLPSINEKRRIDEVVKMSDSDQIKFGVLIGLIKVESVSNNEVVNTILHLVSTFMITISYIIKY